MLVVAQPESQKSHTMAIAAMIVVVRTTYQFTPSICRRITSSPSCRYTEAPRTEQGQRIATAQHEPPHRLILPPVPLSSSLSIAQFTPDSKALYGQPAPHCESVVDTQPFPLDNPAETLQIKRRPPGTPSTSTTILP